MLEHSVRPSSAAWADYQEGWGRSRASTDTGLEAAHCHTCGSCQHLSMPCDKPGPWGWAGSAGAPVCVSENRQQKRQSHQMPLVETSLASANRDCHSPRYWTMLAKGFSQGSSFGERWGSILLQSDPFSHSLLGYFSGNEIPTHKEAKH